MANCTRVPPEPAKPTYLLELSEPEAVHLRSVISRIAASSHDQITGETFQLDDSIHIALVNAKVPNPHTELKPNLVNRGT